MTAANKPIDGWAAFLKSWVLDAGIVMLFNGLIGWMVHSMTGKPLTASLIASQLMGLSLYSFIATPLKWRFGRHRVAPPKFKLGAIVLGSVIGVLVGLFLTQHWAVATPAVAWSYHLDQPLFYLVMSLVVMSLNVAYFSYRKRLQLQAAALAQAEQRHTEAQLRLLQAQLEPHMLFNVLATLHTLIDTQPTQAKTLLEALTEYLRSGVQANRQPWHPLEAEFQFLSHYLSLQQQRFGSRLRYRFELPEDCADIPVPPLLLQPLVENAMKHGIEPALNGGEIEVIATRQQHQLCLQVNNRAALGSGAATTTRGLGTGLSNVSERLQLCFGPSARLDFQAPLDAEDPNGMTRVTLTFTIRELASPPLP